MDSFIGGFWLIVAFVLMCFGIVYLKGPFFEKRECESMLPRHIECTYQPPPDSSDE